VTAPVQAGGAITISVKAASKTLTVDTGATITSTGGKDITLEADTLALGADVKSTGGTLTVQPFSPARTIGIGKSATGDLNIDETEVARFVDGFAEIVIGRADGSGAIDIRDVSFTDPLTLRTPSGSGAIGFAGAVSTGSDTLKLEAGGGVTQAAASVVTAGTLTGTADSLTLDKSNQIASLGPFTATKGLTLVDDRDLTVGGAVKAAGLSLKIIKAGQGITTTAAGTLTATGGKDITLEADTLAIGADITGTGILTLQPLTPTQTIGIGKSATGGFNLDETEVAHLVDGFTQIIIGRADGSGAIDVRDVTFTDSLTLRTPTAGGSITFTGAVSVGVNTLTLIVGGSIIQNTGTLTAGTIDATVSLDAIFKGPNQVEVIDGFKTGGNFLFNSAIDLEVTDPIEVGGDLSLTVLTAGKSLSVGPDGTLTSTGGGAITLEADVIAISAALTSKGGALTLQPHTPGQDIGVGDGAAGGFNLTGAEIAFFTNGFKSVTIGREDGKGKIDVRAVTFIDPLVLRTPATGGAVVINGKLFGDDDASITIKGSGSTTTLLADIVTAGNFIKIEDSVATPANALLDTTNNLQSPGGAGIGITGAVFGSGIRLRAGSGLITSGPMTLTSLTVFSNGGSASLGGSINGITDERAAQLVSRPDGVNAAYTFNGCTMASVCLEQLPDNTAGIPVTTTIPTLPVFQLPTLVGTSVLPEFDPSIIQFSNTGNEELW